MVKKKSKKINIKTKKEKKKTSKETTPAVWNPWDIIESMDRWFWEDPWEPWPRLWRRRWGFPGFREWWPEHWLEPNVKYTNIDLVDKGKEYKVIAEMPGVSKEDVEVSITPNSIDICGETKTETKEEDKGYIRRERSYSTICRTMMFPEEVNPEKAEATLKDGILEITVEKKTPTVGRKIKVK